MSLPRDRCAGDFRGESKGGGRIQNRVDVYKGHLQLHFAVILPNTEISSPSLLASESSASDYIISHDRASSLSSVESDMPTTILITGGNRGMHLRPSFLYPSHRSHRTWQRTRSYVPIDSEYHGDSDGP